MDLETAIDYGSKDCVNSSSSTVVSRLKEELKDFLSYIASEKGLALNSVDAHRRDLTSFCVHLKNHSISSFVEVKEEHIVSHLAQLNTKKYATSSISRALIAIKVLFRFLKREGHISTNIALYLETPKIWQLIPEVLTHEEMEHLLFQPDTSTWMGARDRAILELLYACGLRVSEVCTVPIQGVDDTFVRVIGKGNKERLVPLGRKALDAIDYYLTFQRGPTANQEILFIGKRGRPLSRMDIWKMIKGYAKQAGITKNISPHTMRHTFATHLLDNGADLRVIQEMLGHAHIGSTDRYTHVSRVHLQEAFDAFHPRK